MAGIIVRQYLGYSEKPWVSAVSLAGGVVWATLGGWYHCVSVSRVLGEAMGVCNQPCGGVGIDRQVEEGLP